MAVNTTDEPSWRSPGDWTGADGEFSMRADAVMDLGTGLHQLAALAERHVAELDQLSAVEVTAKSLSAQLVPPELRDTLSQKFASVTGELQQQVQDHLDSLDPSALADVRDPFAWVLGELAPLANRGLDTARDAFADVPVRDHQVFPYLMQLGMATARQPRLPSIRRALLITAVASAESTFRGVLHRLVFDRDGGSWNLPAHDQAASKLMEGGIERWEQNLREAGFDLRLTDATCDWSATREIWARRHALVHNGGLADARYARRVPGAATGVMLEVDDTYLRTAIDLLCGFVLGVIIMAWDKLSPANRVYVVYLACSYAAAAEGEQRWPLVETLYMLAARRDSDRIEAAVQQVNSWLARVRWRGPESVRGEVSGWETEGLPPTFVLAKEILLGHLDQALAMLAGLVKHGDISTSDLQTWPLFSSIRDEPAFQQLVKG